MNSKVRKALSLFSVSVLTVVLLNVADAPAKAAPCKPVKPTGKTVGIIKAGSVELPIKAFSYPAGGVMEPQGTTLAAGLSKRHMPLNSKVGTSVITWHINYQGCWNDLNILMSQKPGFRFSITDENGKVRRYEIEKKLVVDKGEYKKSWFTLVSPRKLTLVTCTGTFKNGHYTDNMIFIATPVS